MQDQVSVGPTTVAGGAVSLTAFVAAIIAFATGARDAATISAVATGLVSLVAVLLGRYAQATAQVRHAPVAAEPVLARPPEA